MDEQTTCKESSGSAESSDIATTKSQEQCRDTQPTREELLAHVRAQPGTALVKADFIDFTKVSERFKAKHGERKSSTEQQGAEKRGAEGDGVPEQPPSKKQKVRGQNKRRPRNKHTQPADRPCLDFLRSGTCRFSENCKYSHDIKKLVDGKPPDIGDNCILFENFGQCQYGVLCRFGSSHIDANLQSIVNEEKVKETGGQPVILNTLTKDLQIKLRKRSFQFKKYDEYMKTISKGNRISKNASEPKKVDFKPKDMTQPKPDSNEVAAKSTEEACQGLKNVGFPATEDSSSSTDNDKINETATSRTAEGNLNDNKEEFSERTSTDLSRVNQSDNSIPQVQATSTSECMLQAANGATNNDDSVAVVTGDGNHAGAITDEDTIRTRMEEKKKLDVEGKLLLAPLTTVGNLPYRAICKKLGADITCGEMAMCTNLLQGQTSEWALLKRHPSEDVFGVQLCGAFPDTMTKCAELLNQTIDIDFVDINVGCPIDMVYHKGAGSGLMNRMGKFQEIVRGMSAVLDIPLTVKMRTGVYEGSLIAHKLIPRIYDWGASVVAVHGRTREQRYTKQADWSYLGECAQAADPYPFIGNGDILSYEDANFFRKQSGCSGLMIARGALIKPWIFTEIQEQRHWDISSSERLDILRNYVDLGLMHWGSDTEGVSKTRRFLLEWLSFLHRYIPVGLLEQLPQKINERPPYFVGRNDLETLMASANCNDWLKISEMLLGPAPADFEFLPKHKANSYK